MLDGLNRYAYCGNSPVMYTDPSGHFIFSALGTAILPGIGTAIGAIIDGACWGAVIGTATGAAVNAITQGIAIAGGQQSEWSWDSFWSSSINGAITGAVTGGVLQALGILGVIPGTVGGSGSLVMAYGPLNPSLTTMPFYSNLLPIQAFMTNLPYNVGMMGISGISAFITNMVYNDPCEELRKKIKDARDELVKRYQDMREDKLDMYNTRRFGPKMTWESHIGQYETWQKRLRKLLEQYNNIGCGDGGLPGDVWDIATRPAPSKPAPKPNNYYETDDVKPKLHPVFGFLIGAAWLLYSLVFGS